MCFSEVVSKNDLGNELKAMMDYVLSEEWVEIVEGGNKQEFEVEFAASIDPLTTKLMDLSGEQFVASMSFEMGNWVKDTTILWIKNKGAGNTTTEAEVIKR
jgi:hypothetical protein